MKLETIADKLKSNLENSGFTIYKLAQCSGIPESTIKNIFYGRSRKPNFEVIKNIAFHLNCQPSDLLADDDSRKQDSYAKNAFVFSDVSVNRMTHLLEIELKRVDNVITQIFDVALTLAKRVGKEIVQNGYGELDFINTLLSNNIDKENFHDIFSWTLFDWMDKNNNLIASSDTRIEAPKNLENVREYVKHVKDRPWEFVFDPISIGIPCGRMVIPAALGVKNEKDEFLGAVTMSFNLENLDKRVKDAVVDENICYALLDKEKRIVFHSFCTPLDYNSDFFARRLSGVDINGQGTFSNRIDFRNSIYSHYKEIKRYPFYILVGYVW
ncbi:MAG: helix-turn-helix domain-containing protein [Alphaproteobacteria bacterium]